MIRKIAAIYFSPAGGTERMVRALADDIAERIRNCSPEEITVEYHDLRKDDGDVISLNDETIAVIGMPVYIGKIPVPGARALNRIQGAGAMTVVAVSFGGRSFGNALYELRNRSEDRDLKIVGAGGFMISYRAARGSSRSSVPAMDIQALSEFSNAVSGKIMRLAGCTVEGLRIKPAPVEVKGKMPVHMISLISPKAAEAAQEVLQMINRRRRRSEWFL